MKPICIKCEREYKMEDHCYVAEMFRKNKEIYKIWSADLWSCPVCGHKIVSGFADKPGMEHWNGDCEAEIERLKKLGRIIVKNKEWVYDKDTRKP